MHAIVSPTGLTAARFRGELKSDIRGLGALDYDHVRRDKHSNSLKYIYSPFKILVENFEGTGGMF
jgi:hypothetical protein